MIAKREIAGGVTALIFLRAMVQRELRMVSGLQETSRAPT